MNGSNKQLGWAVNSPRMSSLNTQQHKLDMQKNQLKVIFKDFKKVKSKCESLFSDLGEQFEKKEEFDKMQKTTAIKTQLLDLQGIVGLKNQLIRALTQLYDLEHQLVYKKQRNQMRFNSPQAPKIKKRPQFPPQIEKFTLQVPIYNSRQQENMSKIERVSSYLYDLRKNMRRLSTAIFKNYETTDFLMNEPQYLQLKEKVQRHRMRNQQLTSILQRKIQQQVQKFISSCQCVQDNDQYKIIKVYDSDVKDLGRWYELTQTREWNDAVFAGGAAFRNFKVKSRTRPELSHVKSQKDIRSLRLMKINPRKDQSQMKDQRSKDPHDTSVNKNLKSSRISKRSSRIGCQIKDQTEEKGTFQFIPDNYAPLVQKFGQQSEKNLSVIQSLSSLRSKRKKVFTDDVWDQFEKI